MNASQPMHRRLEPLFPEGWRPTLFCLLVVPLLVNLVPSTGPHALVLLFNSLSITPRVYLTQTAVLISHQLVSWF